MIKPRLFCDWTPYLSDFEVPVDIYCDGHFIYADRNSDAVKILWLNEPREILQSPYAHALTEWSSYDYVLTWDEYVLSSVPNAVYFRNDTCWVGDYVHEQKKFAVSTVVGFKKQTVGHRMRHDLWNRRGEIRAEKMFYSSMNGGPKSGLVLGADKRPLFDAQFHIVIENVRSRNMFTEKLTDACRAKSVPIYWGCPNVGDFYDERGIIQCSDVGEIITACNELSAGLYNSMLPHINFNYARSLELVPLHGRGKISETIALLVNKM